MTRPKPHEDTSGAGRRVRRSSVAQYLRLGVHAGAGARAVIRAAHRLLAHNARRDRARRRARHAWLRSMLDAHDDAKTLYTKVSAGDIGHE